MNIASLFFLLSFTGLLEASTCPTDKDMAPCKCRSMSYGNVVDCKTVLNSEALIPPMQALVNSGTILNVLTIENSSLLYLPEILFQKMDIRTVDIKNSEIVSLSEFDTAFNGLEDSLRSLIAINVTILSEWDFDQFRNFQRLFFVYLENVTIFSIDNALPHLPDLYHLTISGATLSYVSDDAFSNLPKLTEISLLNNDITEMKRTMFPNPADSLSGIDLSENKLAYLPKDFFDNMPNLVAVYLAQNKFTTLAEKPFSVAFRNLQMMSLTDNPIRCDCRMRWLVKIKFPHYFWGKCSSPAFLSGRGIEELDSQSLWC